MNTKKSSKFWDLTPYISEEEAENIKQYKYAGGDNGLVYTYFYNPVSKKLVNFLPEWLA